jgi:hypothetical protein
MSRCPPLRLCFTLKGFWDASTKYGLSNQETLKVFAASAAVLDLHELPKEMGGTTMRYFRERGADGVVCCCGCRCVGGGGDWGLNWGLVTLTSPLLSSSLVLPHALSQARRYARSRKIGSLRASF